MVSAAILYRGRARMSSTMVQNGGVKLTGWAQAAAKALPKQQPRPKAAASSSTSSLSSTNGKGKKKPVRQPYNREEVRSYMKSLFEEQVAQLGSRETFSRGSQQKNGSLDWGAVTSSKYRNRKYGCLNEIAQVLCK